MPTEQKRFSVIQITGYQPLRDVVFDTLKTAILNQTIAPGERLMEQELAEELGVSRTPVRESIRKLEQEGLVVMIPRKGAYVAKISLREIHEVYEIRAAMEALALELAARYITDEELDELELQIAREQEMTESAQLDEIIFIDSSFHDLLYQYARNTKLTQIVELLQEQFKRFRALPLKGNARKNTALHEHKAMVEALRAHDGELAATLARKHIMGAEEALLTAWNVDAEQSKSTKGCLR